MAGPVSAQFTVLRFAGGWQVLQPRQRQGRRFDFQVDAVEAALKLAENARRAGLRPEILVQTASGEITRLDHDLPGPAPQPAG